MSAPNPSASQTNDSVIATATDTFAVVPNLINGKSYTFSISAINSQGKSAPITTPPISVGSGIKYTAPTTPGAAWTLTYPSPSPNAGSGALQPILAYNPLTGSSVLTEPDPISNSLLPPSVPRNVSAEIGNNSTIVHWDPPASVGGSAITSYKITATSGTPALIKFSTTVMNTALRAYTISGLTNGILYTISVYAINNYGVSPDETTTITPNAVAQAPVITSTTYGDGQVTLNWIPNTPTGVSDPTSFQIYGRDTRATPSIEFRRDIDPGPNERTATLTGLTNGHLYYFRMISINSTGQSPSSTIVSITPNPLAPDMIPGSDITLTTRDSSMVVSWVVPSNGGLSEPNSGGSSITQYIITATTVGPPASTVSFKVPANPESPTAEEIALLSGAQGETIRWKIDGLTNGLPYTVTVLAVNPFTPLDSSGNPIIPPASVGTSSSSLAPAPTVPDAIDPATLTAVKGNYQATVSWEIPDINNWSIPSNTSQQIDKYRITVLNSIGTVLRSIDGITTQQSAGTIMSYTVSDLTNIYYTFKVASHNTVGYSADSATAVAVLPDVATDAPTVTATPLYQSVAVAWTTSATNPTAGVPIITSYTLKLYDATGTTVVRQITGISPSLTQTTVTSLTNNTTYLATVIAINSAGPSAEATRVTVIPDKTVPQNTPTITATTSENYSASVTWTAPALNADSTPIDGYEVTLVDSSGATVVTATDSYPLLLSSATRSYTATGLTNFSCRFNLRAFSTSTVSPNPNLYSGYQTSAPVIPKVATAAPTVTATSLYQSVAVAWTTPTTNPAAGIPLITSYTLNLYDAAGTTLARQITDISPSLTQTTITSLTNNTTYLVTVIAINSAGPSAEATRVTVLPDKTVPQNAPTITATAPGSYNASVTWTAPAPNADSTPIDGYEVMLVDSSGETVTGLTDSYPLLLSSATRSYTIAGLTNVPYSFKLRAFSTSTVSPNPNLYSGYQTSSPIIPNVVTAAPTLTATSLYQSVAVAWTTPTTNPAAGIPLITSYTLNLYDAAGEGTTLLRQITDISPSLTQTTVTSLTNAQTYLVTVIAINSAGSSAEATKATVIPDATTPQNVPGITTTIPGSYSAVLTWTAPAPNADSTPIDGYEVTLLDSSGETVTGLADSYPLLLSSATRSYTATGITNVPYSFKLRAFSTSTISPNPNLYSGYQTSPPIIPNVVTAAPTVTATPQYQSAILAWTTPTTNPAAGVPVITSYTITVYDSTGTTQLNQLTGISSSLTQTTVSSLTNNTTYNFTVIAVNSAGPSLESTQATATPSVQPPNKVTGVSGLAQLSQITLSWNVPSFNGGSDIIGYNIYAYNVNTSSYIDTNDFPIFIYSNNLTPSTQSNWNVPGQTLSYVLTGLSNIPYKFTVVSLSSIGSLTTEPVTTIDSSITSDAIAPLSVTDAPIMNAAIPSYSSALVSWTTPTNGILSIPAITSYSLNVYYNGTAVTSGLSLYNSVTGTFLQSQPFNTLSPSITSVRVSGLINDMGAYTFTVTTLNSVGSSAEATPNPIGGIIPTPSPPDAPVITQSVGIDTAIVVHWVAPFNGGTPITGYTLACASPSINVSITSSTDPGILSEIQGAPISYTITGLTNGIPYDFTLVAQNNSGSSTPTVLPTITPNPINIATRLLSFTPGFKDGDVSVAQSGPITAVAYYLGFLYFIDSGTNSLRRINLQTNKVTTLIYGTVTGYDTVYNGAFYTSNSQRITFNIDGSINTITNNVEKPSAAEITTMALTGGCAYLISNGSLVYYPSPAAQTPSHTIVSGLNLTSVIPIQTSTNPFTVLYATSSDNILYKITPPSIEGAAFSANQSTNSSDYTYSIVTTYGTPITFSSPSQIVQSPPSFTQPGPPSSFTSTKFCIVDSSNTICQIYTNCSVPSTPTSALAIPGNGCAYVFWLDPGQTSILPVTYTVISNPGGICVSTTDSSTGILVTGLTNGIAYTFSVYAVNSVGDSLGRTTDNAGALPSDYKAIDINLAGLTTLNNGPITPIVDSLPPTSPTITSVSATVVGSYGAYNIAVTFTAPASSGSSALSGYLIQLITTSYPMGLQYYTLNADNLKIPVLLTGIPGEKYLASAIPSTITFTQVYLPANCNYSVRVFAINQAYVSMPAIQPIYYGQAAITGTAPTITSISSAVGEFLINGNTNGSTAMVGIIPSVSNMSDDPFIVGDSIVAAPSGGNNAYSGTILFTNTKTTLVAGNAYTIYVMNSFPNSFSMTGARYTLFSDIIYSTPCAPSPPLSITSIPYNTSAQISWTLPIFNGNSTVTSYTVTASPGGATVTTANAFTTSILLTGLVVGVQYTFTVVANNSSGFSSAPSIQSSPMTTIAVPDAPTNLQVTLAGTTATAVNLSWNPSTYPGFNVVTGYTIKNNMNGTTWTTATVGTVASPYQITGLTTGLSYIFSIYATNAAGNSYIATAAYSVLTGSTALPVISGVTFAGSPPTATVTYTTAYGGTAASLSYRAYLAVVTEGVVGAYTYYSGANTASNPGVSWTISSVAGPFTFVSGTTYSFAMTTYSSVTATESAKSAAYQMISSTIPSAPTGLTATPGNGFATISWTPAATGGAPILYYTINSYISPYTSILKSKQTFDPSLTSFQFNGLNNGIAYKFSISATNQSGPSTPLTLTATAITPYIPGEVSTIASSICTSPGNAGFMRVYNPTNTIYFTDTNVGLIRSCTTAGDGLTTYAGSTNNFLDGDLLVAKFSSIWGIAVDSSGNIYVADVSNHRIRKIYYDNASSSYKVMTIAGAGATGSTDGTGTSARFNSPFGITVDSAGNLYVTDQNNKKIRKLTPTAANSNTYDVTTIAGTGTAASSSSVSDNCDSMSATFGGTMKGIAVDSSGNLYIADNSITRIRMMTNNNDGTYKVTTLAGALNGSATSSGGAVDGPGGTARFGGPNGIAVDSSRNVYVTDHNNFRICMINNITNGVGTVTTIAGFATGSTTANGPVAGTGTSGSTDGNTISAKFNIAQGIDTDSAGNIYVTDRDNNKIRKIVLTNLSTPSQVKTINGIVGDAVGDFVVALSWTAPFDGNSPITSYTIAYYNAGVRVVLPAITTPSIISSSTPSYTVTGLTSGIPYTFAIIATNAKGSSDLSDQSAAFIPNVTQVPTAPTYVLGNEITYFSAQVNWTASSFDGYKPLTYTVVSSPGGITVTTASTTAILTGLSIGITYTFTVTANNGVYDSPSATSNPLTMVPTAPAVITTVSTAMDIIGRDYGIVTWNVPDNCGAAITEYNIYMYNSSGILLTSPFPSGITSNPIVINSTTPGFGSISSFTQGSAQTFQLGGILPYGTVYKFKILSKNSVGPSAFSVFTNLLNTKPATPAAPTINSVANMRASIIWTAPSNGGASITSYIIKVYDSTGVTLATGIGSNSITVGAVTSYTVPSLQNNTQYKFSITATNSVGNSVEGAVSTASATPDYTAPNASTISTSTPGSYLANGTWTAPTANVDGSPISGYEVTLRNSADTATITTAKDSSGNTIQYPLTVSTDSSGNVLGIVDSSGAVVADMSLATLNSAISPYVFGTIAYNLTNIAYKFKFRTFVTSTVSPFSKKYSGYLLSSAVTPYVTPLAPTAPVQTFGNNFLNITWTPPASTPALTGYNLLVTSPSSSETFTATALTGSSTSVRITGLTNAQPYTFTLEPLNIASTSSYASHNLLTFSGTPDYTAPNATAVYTLTPIIYGEVLTWNTPTANTDGSPISGYEVTLRNSADTATITTAKDSLGNTVKYPLIVATDSVGNVLTVIDSSGNAISDSTLLTLTGSTYPYTYTANVYGLINTAYKYRIRTYVVSTVSPFSNKYSGYFTTPTGVTPYVTPAAPNKTSQSVANTSITFSWSPFVSIPTVTGYILLVTSPSSSTPFIAPDLSTASSATSVTITGLTNNQPYTFTLEALNSASSNQYATRNLLSVTATPDYTAPNAPSIPSTYDNVPNPALSVNTATVNWNAPNANADGSPITGYEITLINSSTSAAITTSKDSAGNTIIYPVYVSNSTFAFSAYNLTAIYYKFNIRAYVGSTISPYPKILSVYTTSSSITPVSQPQEITSMSASEGNTKATVTWTVPISSGYSITNYTIYVYTGLGVAIAPTSVSVTDATVLAAATGTSVSWPIPELTNGSTYKFNITATSSLGTSSLTPFYTNAVMPRPPVGTVSTLVSDQPIFTGQSQAGGYGALDTTNTYLYSISYGATGVSIINLNDGSYVTYPLYNSTGTTSLSLAGTHIGGACIDSTGAFFFADDYNHKVYRSVLSNSKYCATAIATSTNIKNPRGICVDSSKTIYVADSGNSRIVKLVPNSDYTVYTSSVLVGNSAVAATTSSFTMDGTGATFSTNLGDITVDTSDNLYVSDTGIARIRKIRISDGYVTTIAGGGGNGPTSSTGYVDGVGTASKFTGVAGITVDPSGNVFVSDMNVGRICMLVPNSDFTVYTTYSLVGSYTSSTTSGTTKTYITAINGYTDGVGSSASLNHVFGIYRASSGIIYLMDNGGQTNNVANSPAYKPWIRMLTNVG